MMTKTVIQLNTINDVKIFVNIVSKYDMEVDLVSGRYAVDAKSVLGIFSLDLSKTIDVSIHSDDAQALLTELQPFIVE